MIFNYVAGAKDYYDGKLKDFSKVGIKAPDGHTLQITPAESDALPTQDHMPPILVSRPSPPLPNSAARPERHRIGRARKIFTGNALSDLKHGFLTKKIVVERSPSHNCTNVKLDEIDFYPVESADTEEHMFRTGQMDITYEVPRTKTLSISASILNCSASGLG